MSFSKAKIQRFNDIKSCVPGPTAYNVLLKNKVKSAVFSQSEHIVEPKSPSTSETGSTRSVPCRFRTPTLPKQKKTTTSTTTISKPLFTEHFESEALKEKIVECQNKDASIKSLREEIEELRNKMSDLDNQKRQLDLEKEKMEVLISKLKTDHEHEIKNLQEKYEEDMNKVTQEKIKVNNEIELVRKQYEELKEANRKDMNELKSNCDKFNILYNKSVEECKKIVEEKNMLLNNKEHELKALEENCMEIQRKHYMEIDKLKKEHQTEIQDIEFEILKTMTELQKEKELASNKMREIDITMKKTIADLMEKFEEEKEQLLLHYEEKVKETTERIQEEQKHQMKEVLEEHELKWKQKLEEQQQQSNAILQECQTISEYNIIQCELEKKEIETKLTEKTKALETKISEYNAVVSDYEELKKQYQKLQDDFESFLNKMKIINDTLKTELYEKKIEIKKYVEENRTYLITIKNSQNTIEVLKNRLIDSDRDVEQLKKEISDNEAKLVEYENKCLQLSVDLKQAQDYNEELEMQHESAIKLNTSEIQQLKCDLLQKVEAYRKEVETLSEKLRESEQIKKEILQQLHEAHQIIEKLKVEFDCFSAINCQYEFEVEQSQNELEDYRIREIDWNNLKEKLEHNVKELECLLEMKHNEVNDFKKHISQLQDECDSYINHMEYYKNKITKYEREFDEVGESSKKNTEQYDELLPRFEQLERENMEKQNEIARLSQNCRENECFKERYHRQKEDYDILLQKYEQLEKENSWNKKNVGEQLLLKDRLQQTEQERDALLERIVYLEEEFKEISDKYADLAGHHNNKQKIKHLVDLKQKNEELVQANLDLEIKMKTQLQAMEKLKKENSDLKKYAKKSKLHPEDKENIGSPNRSLNSIRIESPFRERN